jgi:hypothetical protein
VKNVRRRVDGTYLYWHLDWHLDLYICVYISAFILVSLNMERGCVLLCCFVLNGAAFC